jgi:hypothetical protein
MLLKRLVRHDIFELVNFQHGGDKFDQDGRKNYIQM